MALSERQIAEHYAAENILEKIDSALRELGHDPENISAETLKPVDEFHSAGVEATKALLGQLEVTPEMQVLDIGCGIGGPARSIASRHNCRVQGIDLTPEYVQTARHLSARVGLDDLTDFEEGSATEIPLEADTADMAWMLHVGMNIPDKQALFAEAARVLRPGGHFVVFDVMEGPVAKPPEFPVPWASSPEMSHVMHADGYRSAASDAGFTQLSEKDLSAFTLDDFEDKLAAMETEGRPPLGLHLLMGERAPDKMGNYVAALREQRIAPVEMIFRAAA